MNKAAISIGVQVYVGVSVLKFLGVSLEVEFLNHMIILCLTYWGTQTFSTVAALFTFLPAMYECSSYTTSLPPTLKFHFYYSHPSEYEVVSSSSFDLYFPND